MEAIVVTASNLEKLRAEWSPLDQRGEIEIGVTLWKTRLNGHGMPVHGILSADGSRAGIATNADSSWGEVTGEWPEIKIALDATNLVYLPDCTEVCTRLGCKSLAHHIDCDGDPACAKHAAKSESWVVCSDEIDGRWITRKTADLVEAHLESIGYDKVTIRAPRAGDRVGSFAVKANGDLTDALDAAVREEFRSDLNKAADLAMSGSLAPTRERWTDVTIRDVDGATVSTGDNAVRRMLMARYRHGGSLMGYYLGDDDTNAEGYDGSTAGPSPDEIDWTGL